MNETQAQTPPQRSAAQLAESLIRANEIRAQRAADKQAIKDRTLDPRSVFDDQPEHWKKAKVTDVLKAIPAIGQTKIDRLLPSLYISPSKTVGGLTADQRRRLNDAIARYVKIV